MYKPIEMLFSSDVDGLLTPIRFRLTTEEGPVVVPVKQPILTEENKIQGSPMLEYKANFIVNDQMRPGRLRFDSRNHIWLVEI